MGEDKEQDSGDKLWEGHRGSNPVNKTLMQAEDSEAKRMPLSSH